MANLGFSTDYRCGFKTKVDYTKYLKNELDKAHRNKRQAEYEINSLQKELERENRK